MLMYVVFVVAIVLIAALFWLLDRGLRAIDRGRRRREAAEQRTRERRPDLWRRDRESG